MTFLEFAKFYFHVAMPKTYRLVVYRHGAEIHRELGIGSRAELYWKAFGLVNHCPAGCEVRIEIAALFAENS